MKKLIVVFAACAALSASASAQGLLGSVLGGGSGSSSGNALGNIITGIANTVYSAPISLNGTYTYNGVAISASKSEGGLIDNIAGSAVTSGLESKADEYLSKVGIKPGAMSFTFNSADNSFVMNCGPVSLPGTYKVGEGEKTVTLTFGKSMQFFCMTGTLESSLSGARMLFPADKLLDFVKKVAAKLGDKSANVKSIAALAEGYDTFRMGFKLGK